MENRMHSEFLRLKGLGWTLPPLSPLGLFMPSFTDESKISFPSQSYNSAEVNNEATGFWATARAKAIAEVLGTAGTMTLWEIGAGNGNAAIPLRDLGFDIIPIEPLKTGAITLVKNGFPAFHSTLENLELPNNSIDTIGAFDVLEHLEKPEILLSEIFRVLKPGGTFVCSVPAYQWLFSDFDISIGHYMRYSRKKLRQLLDSVGLRCESFRFIFGFLVLPAFFLRRIPYLLGKRRTLRELNFSFGGNSSTINKMGCILTIVSQFEKKLKLPFGLSLIAVAKKIPN